MGLLDSFTGANSPTLNVVPLDDGTQKMISNQNKRALTTDLSAQQNNGVKAAGGQMAQTDQSLGQDAARSGQDPAMLGAIRNKFNNVAGKDIQQLVAKNNSNVALKRADLLQQAAKSQLVQQQVETQNYTELANAMNQAEAARAQVLSSVFGAAGTAAGMYMGRKGGGSQRPNTSSDSMFAQQGQEFDLGANNSNFGNIG